MKRWDILWIPDLIQYIVVFDAGYQSVYDVANTTAEEMLERVSKVNNIKHYYKTNLGTKDMQFCIDFANVIVDIENG